MRRRRLRRLHRAGRRRACRELPDAGARRGRHDGQLEGVILPSALAHARITSLDLTPAQAMPGVGAVVSLLGDDRVVRYVGAPIAAVAAKDRKTALAAIAAIRIDTERLPAAVGLEQARKADAPVVFEKPDRKKAGNV